jgi:hypothetical protein
MDAWRRIFSPSSLKVRIIEEVYPFSRRMAQPNLVLCSGISSETLKPFQKQQKQSNLSLAIPAENRGKTHESNHY